MKKSTLLFCLTVVFCCCNLLVFSQDVNTKKFNPDQPVFFTPKNHDPNFLKSGKISERSFYQRKSEWQHIIDSTWGPGDSLSRKLEIFNTYAKAIHDKFDGFYTLKLNWDSLYNHYLSQITESTSKGAFSSIMSQFAYEMKSQHVLAYDSEVVLTPLYPGVPIILTGFYHSFEHFGAVTTILPDSTTLVLRVVPNHPLNLEPGDIILGYEGVSWKSLVFELMDAGIPMLAHTGGCKTADTYNNLLGAGLNWHLFSTMDVVKYSSGDTLHLSVLPMQDMNVAPMVNNEQMPIKNIPFPNVRPWPFVSDTVLTYGIIENTNTGYVYLTIEWPEGRANAQFYNAMTNLKNTDALIIDMRLNYGGWDKFTNTFNVLFNESYKTLEYAGRCNANTFELCSIGRSGEWRINDGLKDYYDHPIAVLLGPSCGSMGDMMAQILKYHPMAKFFGASSVGTLGESQTITSFPGWLLRFSIYDMYHSSEPGNYLNGKEFPIDYPVWFNKEDVAKGIDPIVEKSLSWINNLAYGHDVTIESGLFSPAGNTVTISAIVENPNQHELSAKLIFESMDGTIVDSTDMTVPNLTKVSHLQVKWKTPDSVENTYWVSVKVKDLTDGSSFNNKHATRITTVPLLIDKLDINQVSASKFTFQPSLKNAAKSNIITNLKVNLTSNDPWIKSISPAQVTLSYVNPGQTRKTTMFTVLVDTTTFPHNFNLTFNISSEDWPYWVIDTTVTDPTIGIGQVELLPLENGLEQNYPNPFKSVTTINWQLSKNSKVTLKVLDIVGRTVATLVDEHRPQGKYETQFKAVTLPKGIYFYQLKAGQFSQTRKMVLLE